MSMFVRVALVAMLSLNVYSLATSADDKQKPKLEGQHQIIAGERDGKALNESDIKGCDLPLHGRQGGGRHEGRHRVPRRHVHARLQQDAVRDRDEADAGIG